MENLPLMQSMVLLDYALSEKNTRKPERKWLSYQKEQVF
jgi:hypothetical protein